MSTNISPFPDRTQEDASSAAGPRTYRERGRTARITAVASPVVAPKPVKVPDVNGGETILGVDGREATRLNWFRPDEWLCFAEDGALVARTTSEPLAANYALTGVFP
jgi:sarcosine oxidase gamma subunit